MSARAQRRAARGGGLPVLAAYVLATCLLGASAPGRAAPGMAVAGAVPSTSADGADADATGDVQVDAVDLATIEPPPPLGGLLTQSRVLYPLRVGPWRASAERRYDAPEDGVSVRFVDHRKERWIDLFFYPRPLLRGDQALARLAAGERDNIREAARQSGRAVELGALAPLPLHAADGSPVAAWQLDLRYPDDGLVSAMALFARDLYVVKLRASAGVAHTPAPVLQQQMQAFMQGVALQARVASTGACWLPGRVQVVGRLPAHDDAAVAASYREPDQPMAAVALADRVLVARESAARGPALAAELAAALYPGCVAPEVIEPQVPDALREIRIEYRRSGEGDPALRAAPVGRPRAPLSGTG